MVLEELDDHKRAATQDFVSSRDPCFGPAKTAHGQ